MTEQIAMVKWHYSTPFSTGLRGGGDSWIQPWGQSATKSLTVLAVLLQLSGLFLSIYIAAICVYLQLTQWIFQQQQQQSPDLHDAVCNYRLKSYCMILDEIK